MEKTSDAVPEDIQMETLLRMPLKSLASIVRTKQFRDLYLLRSLTKPRVLFVDIPFRRDVLFHSVHQEEEPLLSSGQQQFQVRVDQETEYGFSHFTRDPRDRNWLQIRSQGAKEHLHQVLTVGSGEESWRRIKCKHPHSPVTLGICKEGVLYYGARSNGDKSLVMSFDVRSEEFSVIELLPEGVNIHPRCNLVNYNGEIALVDKDDAEFIRVTDSNGNGVFEMWVRKETTGKWWRNRIEIPRWEETAENMDYFFKGTIGTGELVFARDHVIQRPFSVLYYDTVTHKIRRFQIQGAGGQLRTVQTFLDHVDTTFLI
ncbi:LOW QUALITY PROTEIN: putative F-box protein At1g70960 [Eutrema salsugineum]|uniref:LOW QUALITY PROTEIN: putative F-box protein At1g70960 n=1 Tax=Eutrema salsugineum TaxID=72664 RepID=UPI000CED1ACE|nr:LOW QUALITY PROTEIN: putative F-box protein At1g70960 [Eutrema salsugineum]